MDRVKKWEIGGAIATIIIGSLLHFVYNWSGDSKFVAFFGAVNESTWEHLKIAFWPMLIFTIIEWFYWGKGAKNFCLASAYKLFIPPIAIIVLFYGWLLIFPDNFIWDISIFVAAIIAGFYVSYKILTAEKKYNYETISIIFIVLVISKFSLMTYYPIKSFLTRDPVKGGYGIEK